MDCATSAKVIVAQLGKSTSPAHFGRRNIRVQVLRWLGIWLAVATFSAHGYCQESVRDPVTAPSDNSPPLPGKVELPLQQSQLADKYKRLEMLMLKMAEFQSGENPRRAALLRQAIAASKERQIGTKFEQLVKLLQQEQIQRAIDGQDAIQSDLQALLQLLLSENRSDRLKSEQARVQEYIRELDRLIRQQRSIQGRTEQSPDPTQLTPEQKELADRTQSLGKMIDDAEQPRTSSSEDTPAPSATPRDPKEPEQEGQQQQGQQQQGQQQQGQQQQGQQQQGQQQQGQQQQGQQQQGQQQGQQQQGQQQQQQGQQQQGQQQQGQQQQGQQQQGQQQQGQQQQGQQQQGQQGQQQPQGQQPQQKQESEAFPGRRRIAAAEDRMRRAEENLKQAEKDGAREEQDAAQQLLEQAKAELEEILRQLREEEIERVLAQLEGRFRKMLEMELAIQQDTERLSKIPAADRTRQFAVRTGTLSLDQRKIILEVDRALALLREEGSSVAFPEAVTQMRTDMESVANRLAEEKVGAITLAIEDDIIQSLKEMIGAFQKAQKEAEERRNQPQQQQQQQGDPSQQPMVDQIAELKMIRSLQLRINTRTEQYAKMLGSVDDVIGQATDAELVEGLQDLSNRQERIQHVTRDIVTKKNEQ